MRNMIDVAWLAGILEGEGSFHCQDNGTSAMIKLSMSDIDVVERAARILGYNGKMMEYTPNKGKRMYTIQMYGDISIQWMMTLYTLMGERRREKIRSILILWKDYEKKPLRTTCRRGHEVIEDNAILLPTGTYACKKCKVLADTICSMKKLGFNDEKIKSLLPETIN